MVWARLAALLWTRQAISCCRSMVPRMRGTSQTFRLINYDVISQGSGNATLDRISRPKNTSSNFWRNAAEKRRAVAHVFSSNCVAKGYCVPFLGQKMLSSTDTKNVGSQPDNIQSDQLRHVAELSKRNPR